MGSSLRWRLQVWHALILLLAISGFGLVLHASVHRSRINEIDAELTAAARVLEGSLRGLPRELFEGGEGPRRPEDNGPPGNDRPGNDRPGNVPPDRPGARSEDRGPPGYPPGPPPGGRQPPRGPPRRFPPLPPRDHIERALKLPISLEERHTGDSTPPYFAVWLPSGRLLKASSAQAESTLSLPSRAEFSKPTNEPQSRQRGLLREVYLLGPNSSEILVGRSIERELADLRSLTFTLLASGACVFVVGLGGGWWLSGRAVRPIQSMSATAATILVTNLSQRIDTARIDDELGELGRILNAMLDRLESAFQQQVRFTADASHELRTPLTIILSHAELALSRQRTPEEYRGALEATLRSARRMKLLIEELLALARSDAGGMQNSRQRVDLQHLVEEAVALIEPLAQQREVRLTVNAAPVEVAGDANRLSQVVTNLLNNAVLYNRPSGEVTISTSQTDTEGVITVADTGLGIPQNDLPHVFERFYRVDKARSSERAGSGLGLAICQSIVAAHGGKICASSQVNVGSTFVVTLPKS